MDDEETDEKLKSALTNAFQSLDPQTREIISWHFGLASPFEREEAEQTTHMQNQEVEATSTPLAPSSGINGPLNGELKAFKPQAAVNGKGRATETEAERKSIGELALEYGLSTEQIESRKDDGLRALIYGRKTRFRCT